MAGIGVLPKELSGATLSKRRPLFLRLDLLPWAPLYAAAISFANSAEPDSTNAWVGFWCSILVFFLHALFCLCEVWFPQWQYFVQCTPVRARSSLLAAMDLSRRVAWV